MRAVLQVFENYQKARVNFVQTVAELATRPQNIEALQNAGVMQLLRPLLLDNVPSIQQSAALALGRLANYNDELAEAVVSNEVLPQLYSLSSRTASTRRRRRSSCARSPSTRRSSRRRARNSQSAPRRPPPPPHTRPPRPGSARARRARLARSGRQRPRADLHTAHLIPSPSHRRSSTRARSTRWWAASRSSTRASRRRRRGRSATSRGTTASCADGGRRWRGAALVLCVQEPSTLKRIAASALSDICKHSPSWRSRSTAAPSRPRAAHPQPRRQAQAAGVLVPRADLEALRRPRRGGGRGRDLPGRAQPAQGPRRVRARTRRLALGKSRSTRPSSRSSSSTPAASARWSTT